MFAERVIVQRAVPAVEDIGTIHGIANRIGEGYFRWWTSMHVSRSIWKQRATDSSSKPTEYGLVLDSSSFCHFEEPQINGDKLPLPPIQSTSSTERSDRRLQYWSRKAYFGLCMRVAVSVTDCDPNLFRALTTNVNLDILFRFFICKSNLEVCLRHLPITTFEGRFSIRFFFI